MKKWMMVIGLILAAGLVLAACGGGGNADSGEQATENTGANGGEVQSFTIEASNFEFNPQEIKVKQGDTVEITLENVQGLHGIEIDGYGVEIEEGKPASFVADQAGEFEFLCSIMCGAGHDDMVGTLIVE